MVTVPVLFLLLSAFSPLVHSLTTFHVIPRHMNQTEAREACRENYTDLVTVYSDEDNTNLTELNKVTGNATWIGLYRDASSQTPNYHVILENKNWYEAQRYCRQNYTDLVSIRDQQHNEEVKSNGSKSTTPFWIGLLRDDWQWTDGGNSAYRNWGNSEPQSRNNCVVLRDGRWYPVLCSETHPALCYNTSIHVSDVALSWEKALDYCQEEKRGGLLQIESEGDQSDVVKELKKKGVKDPVWVGLRQSRLFGFWIWPDGKAVLPYSNWDEGKQPEHQLSQHCGAVVPQKLHKWRDMNCQARSLQLLRSTSDSQGAGEEFFLHLVDKGQRRKKERKERREKCL
ncbi:hypothetical protein QTP86_001160 [Hemibagrus guttatus]|nr:hypothetical protein QTP86_001160 [Hemibagrus guttatus]